MALLINGPVPPRWAARNSGSYPAQASIKSSRDLSSDAIRIAFINNMPDSALEDTEIQFLELVESAAGGVKLQVKLYSLPKVPRGERGLQHLASFYQSTQDLLDHDGNIGGCDALIMTGTEPLQSDLRQEPYWSALTDVLDWAERNTHSTILSCLAAHAGVLHSDGVRRNPLPDKQFGVFEAQKYIAHPLTQQLLWPVRLPHSRWNEVRESDLTAGGYSVLTTSAKAGVDLFVKQKRQSLFVHFQGHPEYQTQTLLKEYRRDIKRFLRGERKTYPTLPHGYFDRISAKLLSDFQESTREKKNEEQMAFFPEAQLIGSLKNSWQSSARKIYANWVQDLLIRKAARRPSMAVTRSQTQPAEAISALSSSHD